MEDRMESVITHLQIIHTWAEFARERDLQFFTPKHLEDIAQWSADAIVMIEEQKQMYFTLEHDWRMLRELLKEQEAVKPKSKVRHGANVQIQHFCGNCNSMLHGKPKFCSECGKGVLW